MGRIRFEPVPHLDQETLDRHKAYSRSLGLPETLPGTVGAAAPFLAVVGGGPSVAGYVDRLKAFDGEIWAINGAWEWCRDNGIDATFYTIDSVIEAPEGVERAILGDQVAPDVFDALAGADVELIPLGHGFTLNASTSAATVPMFACWRGHKHITFFGCESSYAETTHAYAIPERIRNVDTRPSLVWVSCGGDEYVTGPQMILQAEWIAEMARAFPDYIAVEGGGFLSALIEHGDYDVTHICRAIHDQIKEQAA